MAIPAQGVLSRYLKAQSIILMTDWGKNKANTKTERVNAAPPLGAKPSPPAASPARSPFSYFHVCPIPANALYLHRRAPELDAAT